MSRVLVLFAHPGQSYSRVNRLMYDTACEVDDISAIDLYARYPRLKIDIDAEQEQLLAHDVVVMQFPLFWYSTPALLKEWQDLVLEYNFAYGPEGNKLAGKSLVLAITAGGPEVAYSETGRNHFPLRSLLSPLEQTANLCQMRFVAPFVLFSALAARTDERDQAHAVRYRELLIALRDDQLDLDSACQHELLPTEELPLTTQRHN